MHHTLLCGGCSEPHLLPCVGVRVCFLSCSSLGCCQCMKVGDGSGTDHALLCSLQTAHALCVCAGQHWQVSYAVKRLGPFLCCCYVLCRHVPLLHRLDVSVLAVRRLKQATLTHHNSCQLSPARCICDGCIRLRLLHCMAAANAAGFGQSFCTASVTCVCWAAFFNSPPSCRSLWLSSGTSGCWCFRLEYSR